MQISSGRGSRVAQLPPWLIEERLHDARAARRESRRFQDQERDMKQQFASQRARLHRNNRLALEAKEQAEDGQFLRSRIKALEDECEILRRQNCGLAGQLQADQIGIVKLENRLERLQEEGCAPSEQLVLLVTHMFAAWRSTVAQEQRLRLEDMTTKHRSVQADLRQLRGLLVNESRRALGMEAELGRQLEAQVARLALSGWHALTWRNCRAELIRRIEQLTSMQACMETSVRETTCERLEAQLRLVEARCREHEAAAAAAQAAVAHERALRTAAKDTVKTRCTFASIGNQAVPTTRTGPNIRASSSSPRSALASTTVKLQRSFGGSCRAPSAPAANGAAAGRGNFHQHGQVLERMADLQLQRSRRLCSSEQREQLNADEPLLGHSCNRCCCCHCCCKHQSQETPRQRIC